MIHCWARHPAGQTVTIAHCQVATRVTNRVKHSTVEAIPVELITSRRNPIVSQCRAAARTAAPDGPVLLEGRHLVDEALSAALPLECAFVTEVEPTDDHGVRRLERLDRVTRLIQVSPSVMEAISPAASPSGLVALAQRPVVSLERTLSGPAPLVVALLGVQDPGNTGAVIRAVEAGGATGVVTVGGADPFGWKALRGAMGSTLRLPVAQATDITALHAAAAPQRLRRLAAVPKGGTPITEADFRAPTLLHFGGERGLDTPVLASMDQQISIPMQPPVDSLNLAVAAALVVYEAGRQRSVS